MNFIDNFIIKLCIYFKSRLSENIEKIIQNKLIMLIYCIYSSARVYIYIYIQIIFASDLKANKAINLSLNFDGFDKSIEIVILIIYFF